MTLLGIRVTQVLDPDSASRLADLLLDGFGIVPIASPRDRTDGFGVVFPTADHHSWAEIKAASQNLAPGILLQFVVDDADAYAEMARGAGLSPSEPAETHGERVYHVPLPGGGGVSFQSKLTA